MSSIFLSCVLLMAALLCSTVSSHKMEMPGDPDRDESWSFDGPSVGQLAAPGSDSESDSALSSIATGFFSSNHTAACKVTCNHANITLAETLGGPDLQLECKGIFKAFCKPENETIKAYAGFICRGHFAVYNATNATISSCKGRAKEFSGRVLPPRPHNESDAEFHPEFDMGSGPHFPHHDPDSDGEHDDEPHSWWPHHHNHSHWHNHSHGGNHTHCNRTLTAFKKASCKGHSVGIFSKHNTTVEDAVAAAPELANFVPLSEADGFLGTGAVADAEMLGALGHGPSKMVSKCLGFGLHVAGIKRSGGPHPPGPGPHPHPPGPGPHPHPPHHHHHHHRDEEESEGYGDEADMLQLPEDAEVLEDFVEESLDEDLDLGASDEGAPWVPELSHLFDHSRHPGGLSCNATCNGKEAWCHGKFPCHGDFSINCTANSTSEEGHPLPTITAGCHGFYTGWFGHVCHGVSYADMEATVHNGTVSVDALSVCKGKHGASAKEGPWGHGFISWCQGKGINKIKVEKVEAVEDVASLPVESLLELSSSVFSQDNNQMMTTV